MIEIPIEGTMSEVRSILTTPGWFLVSFPPALMYLMLLTGLAILGPQSLLPDFTSEPISRLAPPIFWLIVVSLHAHAILMVARNFRSARARTTKQLYDNAS